LIKFSFDWAFRVSKRRGAPFGPPGFSISGIRRVLQ
jgi:hypothetical protein